MVRQARNPYEGSSRKLVIAFDIGTTFSGASYSVLDPGVPPTIHGVTTFPGHATVNSASKIPTVIYYDLDGNAVAIGAEAQKDGIEVDAEENGWIRTEWFKLHLRSRFSEINSSIAPVSSSSPADQASSHLPPLPLGKSVVTVFSDFLGYLLRCTQAYIRDHHPQGFWESLAGNVDYVLSHPNGWEGSEQSLMRQAAVLAGLVQDASESSSDASAGGKLTFVSEGEASLHFAIEHGILGESLGEGEGVIVVDAGGGTVDISTYTRRVSDGATRFEESSVSQCFFHGSVFVSLRAKHFLQSYLANSKFVDDMDHIVRCFDENTKIRFKSDRDPQYVKFATTRDNDPACNIRYGQLRLSGTDVAMLFEPSVQCIVDAVLARKKDLGDSVTHVVLVGGFSSSSWLFGEVKRKIEVVDGKLNVFRAEHHANKAVSDGSVSFYLDRYVRFRVSKFTYGTKGRRRYEPSEYPNHAKRTHRMYTDPTTGFKWLTNGFDPTLAKGTKISEEKEFSRTYYNFVRDLSELKTFSTPVFCYRGEDPDPMWFDDDPDNYTLLCTISCDISNVSYTVNVGPDGVKFYRYRFDLFLLFGLTELKAQVGWSENGVEKRCAATIVFHDTSAAPTAALPNQESAPRTGVQQQKLVLNKTDNIERSG